MARPFSPGVTADYVEQNTSKITEGFHCSSSESSYDSDSGSESDASSLPSTNTVMKPKIALKYPHNNSIRSETDKKDSLCETTPTTAAESSKSFSSVVSGESASTPKATYHAHDGVKEMLKHGTLVPLMRESSGIVHLHITVSNKSLKEMETHALAPLRRNYSTGRKC